LVDISDIKPQLIFLLVALTLGIITGLLFDLYRRMRNLVSPGPFLTALGDLCFWSIITAITFSSLLKVNFGQVRGYVFLGLAVGLTFYLLVISSYVIHVFVVIELHFRNFVHRFLCIINKFGKLKIIQLPKRIIKDARRIFSKIKKK